MAKEPHELKWIEDLLPEEEYRRKSMFGGFGYYIGEKMVLATFESTGNTTYKNKKYPYEIWNGCMFPVEREHQEKALARFPFLVSHPILPKWLYLPIDTESFEELVTDVMAQAIKPLGYWGSIPKPKTKKGTSKKASSKKDKPEKIDTRTPRMFSDEPAAVALVKAKNISDLKNLGPMAEKEFHKAGIKTAQAFMKLGWKKAMVKLIKANPKNRHSMFAYALIGALENKDWGAISAQEKEEARNFVRSLPRKK
jgi:predicted flap endonuclease-1-like 5' DNA nuclease